MSAAGVPRACSSSTRFMHCRGRTAQSASASLRPIDFSSDIDTAACSSAGLVFGVPSGAAVPMF
jgi:hypothetical protein